MKHKLLLLIATCCFLNFQAEAGTGLTINKVNSCELNPATPAMVFDNTVAGQTENAGYKSPERYYIKNTLNVLKRPLYASVVIPIRQDAV